MLMQQSGFSQIVATIQNSVGVMLASVNFVDWREASPEEPLWQRLMSGPNAVALCLYFLLLGLGFTGLKHLSEDGGKWIRRKQLPVRGKHLDDFNESDYLFVKINKLLAGPFLFLGINCAYFDPNILWEAKELSLRTVLGPIPLYLVIYDFLYTLTHMFLHVKGIYAYVHKHHHRQQAPSRGSEDAINVHPVEFCLGHVNALVTLFLVCRVMEFHIVGSNLVALLYAAASCFNHSRHDIVISVMGVELYTSKDHDVHHRIPNKNYGRAISLWDRIFGTYRKYDEDAPVNPLAQLDPTTGKSYEHAKKQKKVE